MIVYHVTKSRGIRVHILLDITFILIRNNNKNNFGSNDFFILPIFHRNRKMLIFLWLKNHLLYPNLTTRRQKVENIGLQMNSKLLPNLMGLKTEYLIAQLRTGFGSVIFHQDLIFC